MVEKSRFEVLARVLLVFGVLFLFLVAINLLGSSFKLLGKDFVQTLIHADLDPFTGLFIGILATAIVQSSSVTTSTIVGLVSGGIVSVEVAVPMIMGANIGTTVTNAIVSFGHASQRDEFRRAFSGSMLHDFFNVLCVAILLPVEVMTGFLAKSAGFLSGLMYGIGGVHYKSPIKVFIGGIAKDIQQYVVEAIPFSKTVAGVLLIVIAFVLIAGCLFSLVKLLKSLVMNKVVQALDRTLSQRAIVTMGIGVIITVLVQSSSVTTSILVPLIGAGIISLEVAFPITLGANIGTTATALLAALAGTQAGLTIALVHLLFNITGIAMIYPWKPIRRIPVEMARRMGDLVARKRRVAVLFVLFLFFVLPACVMMISRSIG
jgi:solute carrier family 34 (sodium-dependent phosphate cotransporter)